MFDVFTFRLLAPLRSLTFLMADAPKDPDFVEKYKKLEKKARKLIDTFDVDHQAIYLKAADKHLKDDDGLIDFEKLEDEAVRGKFADAMAAEYQEKARKFLKSGVKPEDEYENQLLTQAVYGTTKEQLKQILAKAGKFYTAEQHIKSAKEMMKAIKSNIASVPAQHIDDKHIDDILKYVKVEKSAEDSGYQIKKDAVTRDDAIQMLGQYLGSGYIGKPFFESPDYKNLFKKKKK